MKLVFFATELSVAKLHQAAAFDASLLMSPFFSLVRTPRECSLVCETRFIAKLAPGDLALCEDGWRAFCVDGTLDFALTGVMAKLSTTLAQAGVSLFAISTYDTDWILVKRRDEDAARRALGDAGHEIVDS